ncbi:sirohydrochlorin chelatase [Staphylococcus nepalensis]|uniref:sirohydrochlorin chelatase n=1 Tax=Staphylococcus nepalensis TaxID=214473 RepID=UPI001E2CB752|nr:sirohydrochlorin chelatase [Staphylococcus nepalensis]MCD8892351.1 sirohydrochlorin chelatase [Staphylococcus nepalensis]
MQGVLYVSHGSRVAEAVEEATSFIELVQAQVDVPLQEICFLELAEPDISQGFQKLVNQGANEIAIIPVLLLSAGHYYKDIPEEIEYSQQQFPEVKIVYGQPLGVQARLTEILKQRFEKVDITPNSDAKLLIIGRGSYNPQTKKDFSIIKSQLSAMLPSNNISVCYLAACEPLFEDALNHAVDEGYSQIFILPYIWFTGILDQYIAKVVNDYQKKSDIILTEHLSHHEHLQTALKERVEEAFQNI